MLDILILSTYDADGSGIFARQLLSSVEEIGYKAKIVSVTKSDDHPGIIEILPKYTFRWFLYRFKMSFARQFYGAKSDYAFLETNSISPFVGSLEAVLPSRARLVICTFLSGLLSPRELLKILVRLGNPPVIFWCADLNIFTGGCHYPGNCIQYLSDCSKCPAVFQINQRLVKSNFAIKKKALSSIGGSAVIASSSEHRAAIKKSEIFKNYNVSELFLPVDKDLFGGEEKYRDQIRHDYCVSEAKVIMIRSSSEPRKGGRLFVEAIRLLYSSKHEFFKSIKILCIGDNYIASQLKSEGMELDVCSLGFISDQYELARLYTISDVFVSPSLADAGPMMLAQSLMSYTPVVSTRVGLAVDLIIPEVNGIILPNVASEALANAIYLYFSNSNEKLSTMREQARRVAIERLDRHVYMKSLSEVIANTISASENNHA